LADQLLERIANAFDTVGERLGVGRSCRGADEWDDLCRVAML